MLRFATPNNSIAKVEFLSEVPKCFVPFLFIYSLGFILSWYFP